MKPFQQNINEIKSFLIDVDSICAMNNNGDVREYVDTKLGADTTVRSLLDTGAMVDAISEGLVKECGRKDEIDTSKASTVELANKQTAVSAGTINIPVEIQGQKYEINFRVVPDLKPQIIYGTPFLNQTGILTEFRNSVNSHLKTYTTNKTQAVRP